MQYKILTAKFPINEEQLEKLGHEGWQLVTVVEWRGSFFFYFARLSA